MQIAFPYLAIFTDQEAHSIFLAIINLCQKGPISAPFIGLAQ